MADKPLKALDVIMEDTTFSTGDKTANVNVVRVCVLGLAKVSVVFALISLTDIASLIVKMSLNKDSGTVQCAYLKRYAKLHISLPQVDKNPTNLFSNFSQFTTKTYTPAGPGWKKFL